VEGSASGISSSGGGMPCRRPKSVPARACVKTKKHEINNLQYKKLNQTTYLVKFKDLHAQTLQFESFTRVDRARGALNLVEIALQLPHLVPEADHNTYPFRIQKTRIKH
jgi:hypothetical protein